MSLNTSTSEFCLKYLTPSIHSKLYIEELESTNDIIRRFMVRSERSDAGCGGSSLNEDPLKTSTLYGVFGKL